MHDQALLRGSVSRGDLVSGTSLARCCPARLLELANSIRGVHSDQVAGECPLVGYEMGRRMGARVIGSRFLRRISGTVDKAVATLHARGAIAVLLGRFTAVLRALVPALAGTAKMPYRTFVLHNAIGGTVCGIGYCLLGYLAGSAYAVVERQVGTGSAIGLAARVAALLAVWAVRRHWRGGSGSPVLADDPERSARS